MIRMLVATDGSEYAIRAARFAARLAREVGTAEVLLLNVGHVPVYALGGPGPDALVDLGQRAKYQIRVSRTLDSPVV